jgi:hypothetical protein
MTGCKTTGYSVRLVAETEKIGYASMQKIEILLKAKGFNEVTENLNENKYSSNVKVHRLFVKKFTEEEVIQLTDPYILKYIEKSYNDERHRTILISLFLKYYNDNQMEKIEIAVYNHYIGGISPKIREEIDNIGNTIHHKMLDEIGKESVAIEREEWGPPRF